jgi:FkbM family methyltransferase
VNVAKQFLRMFKRNVIALPFYRRLVNSLFNTRAASVLPGHEYYNDTFNDRWIAECLFPNRRNGFFLEAGAADGIGGSSCYILEKAFGWTGICIEPNALFFDALVANRPHANCQRVCLSDTSGQAVFIQGDGTSLSPYYSGLKSSLEKFKYNGEEAIQNGSEVVVETITLEKLLDKCAAPRVIDYAAFDIEGSELTVLKNFPFDKYTILAVSIECDGGNVWKFFTRFFDEKGYREVYNPFNKDKYWERYWVHKSIRYSRGKGPSLVFDVMLSRSRLHDADISPPRRRSHHCRADSPGDHS